MTHSVRRYLAVLFISPMLAAAQSSSEVSLILSGFIPLSEYTDHSSKGIGCGASFGYFIRENISVGARIEYVSPYGTILPFASDHVVACGSVLFYNRDPFLGISVAAGADLGGLFELKFPTRRSFIYAPRVGVRIPVALDIFLDLGFRYTSTLGEPDRISYVDMNLGVVFEM